MIVEQDPKALGRRGELPRRLQIRLTRLGIAAWVIVGDKEAVTADRQCFLEHPPERQLGVRCLALIFGNSDQRPRYVEVEQDNPLPVRPGEQRRDHRRRSGRAGDRLSFRL